MPTINSSSDPKSLTWGIRTPADLGRAIAGARRDRGLSQEKLAGELGIERSYLSELEAGGSTIALERTLRALRRLGATVTVTLPEDDARR
jgi:transcriptional regulator with XRE-family HTH domain